MESYFLMGKVEVCRSTVCPSTPGVSLSVTTTDCGGKDQGHGESVQVSTRHPDVHVRSRGLNVTGYWVCYCYEDLREQFHDVSLSPRRMFCGAHFTVKAGE